jgi:hypothetical protein
MEGMENLAANAGVDTAPEGVATPMEGTDNLAANAGADTAPEGVAAPTEPALDAPPAPEPDPELTVTQTVARRLKEEMEKFEREKVPELKQAARDEYIASLKIEWPAGSGNYIKTEAELQAAREKQAIIDRYQAQGLPQDVIEKLTKVDELERWRQEQENQVAQQRAAIEAQQREIGMYQQFFADFPELANKTAEEYKKLIPQEVWDEGQKWLKSGGREGLPLSAAYERHLYRQHVRAQQTQQANAANAAGSTGSAKGKGATTPQYFTEEQVAAMTPEEAAKNLEAIKASRKHWKK